MYRQTLVTTYFAFTSLTTVGFGDYSPRSNPERCFIVIVLLFGVSIFSLIMGIFIDILNDFLSLKRSDFDDSENLNKFFEVFKRYNGDKHLKPAHQ